MSGNFDLKSCILCDFPYSDFWGGKKEKYKMLIFESQMYIILSVSSWFNSSMNHWMLYACEHFIGDLYIYSKCDFHVDDENCE